MTSPTLLDLTKAFEEELVKADILEIPNMDTRLIVDQSGSMEEEFENGWVDKTIALVAAAALRFDSDGELEIGFFNNSLTRYENVTARNVGMYTKKHGVRVYGGTSYAPAVYGMTNQHPKDDGITGWFVKKLSKLNPRAYDPAYTVMVTDGDNADSVEFFKALDSMDKAQFLQIIAIGDQVTMHNLNSASHYSNVAVQHLRNPHSVTDEEFFKVICNAKFKTWLESL